MDTEKSRQRTLKHIGKVRELANVFASTLRKQAWSHDASKLLSPELEMYASCDEKLCTLTYGSAEYEKQKAEMFKEALGHHYEQNRHHPEHFTDGVSGMNLLDLVEMFCDWQAACERQSDGNMHNSIDTNTSHFKLSPQLASILHNTVEVLR